MFRFFAQIIHPRGMFGDLFSSLLKGGVGLAGSTLAAFTAFDDITRSIGFLFGALIAIATFVKICLDIWFKIKDRK